MFSISAIAAAASSGTALHQHRHLGQAGQLRGAQAPFARDDLVATAPLGAIGRTRIGCMMPCALMLSASS